MGPLRPTPHPVTRIKRSILVAGVGLLIALVAGLDYAKQYVHMPNFHLTKEEAPVLVAKLPDVLTKPAPTYAAPTPKEQPPQAQPITRTPIPEIKPPAPERRLGPTPAPIKQAITPTLPDFLQPSKEPAVSQPANGVTAGTQNATTRQEKPERKAWLITPKKGNIEGSEPKKTEMAKEVLEQKGQAANLIKPAVWALPQKPLRTIYASQLLYGVTETAIDSSIPGRVIIRLSSDVQDKFGYQTVLIPRETLVIASQDQQPIQYGISRISLKLEQLEFPNGTVLSLKAIIGDSLGATGLTGKINNHYGKMAIAVGASAILNIGARAAAGQPGAGAFQPTIQQEAARDVGQQVQRDASSIIDRELRIRPTITIPPKTVCTIMLSENIQMNHRPVIVK
jgi:type IV secretion system protein VirB10